MTVSHSRIADFCETGSGTTPSRASSERYYGGPIPWVKSGELRGSIILYTEETVNEQALAETSLKLVPANAILVAMYGATVGKVAVLGVPATTNQAICHIVPDPSKADTRYLFHALQFKLPEFVERSVGGAQPNINQQIVRETRVFLPPLDEQRRIAAILDKADSLRAKRRAAIAKLDSLTQSIFLDMFGDPEVNPHHLTVATLGDFIVSGPQNGLYKPTQDYGTGMPILRIDSFHNGRVHAIEHLKRVAITQDEAVTFGLRECDIVINRVNSRSHLGKSAIIPPLTENTVFESNMMRFRLRRESLHPAFLIEMLQTRSVRKQVLGMAKDAVNQSSINQQDVKRMKITVPPILSQEDFVRRVAKARQASDRAKESLRVLNVLFASLQHQAFQGDIGRAPLI